MKEITKRLSDVGATRLPGWGRVILTVPGWRHYKIWLPTDVSGVRVVSFCPDCLNRPKLISTGKGCVKRDESILCGVTVASKSCAQWSGIGFTCAWLEKVRDVASNRCQWRFYCQIARVFTRDSTESLVYDIFHLNSQYKGRFIFQLVRYSIYHSIFSLRKLPTKLLLKSLKQRC
ncbi:hypothetical protein T265_02426 [Opisthorchis viverrini]|uniref:Uncharacterized protein n=1 Tax=Opisthorchis viverrini TaxID=6198 RepID=A0A074ZW74_OPIVI|nr:hypothetical protein T265_02426 [Opisthorchis viverrini]KER31381.1 hypothetical protein T265_02426 [Opisthorchis viverrini]